MTVGLIMLFDGVSSEQYDQVMRELGLALHDDFGANWPEGIISHVAGGRPDGGWTVVDIWESQEAFDKFFNDRLGPALGAVGTLPQPTIAPFVVHNHFRHASTSS